MISRRAPKPLFYMWLVGALEIRSKFDFTCSAAARILTQGQNRSSPRVHIAFFACYDMVKLNFMKIYNVYFVNLLSYLNCYVNIM